MIKKFKIDNKNNFNISGTFDDCNINLKEKDVLSQEFYKNLINKMMTIKKTILKNYYDDGKLIGGERTEIMGTIDEFLTFFSLLSLIHSNNPDFFQNNIGDSFHITIAISGYNTFTGNGTLANISAGDITNYEEWFDKQIIENFKNIISMSKDQSNNQQIQKKITDIFYNLIILRYKIEFF